MTNPFPYETKLSGFHNIDQICHHLGLTYLVDYIYRSCIEFGSREWTVTVNFKEESDLVLFKFTTL